MVYLEGSWYILRGHDISWGVMVYLGGSLYILGVMVYLGDQGLLSSTSMLIFLTLSVLPPPTFYTSFRYCVTNRKVVSLWVFQL